MSDYAFNESDLRTWSVVRTPAGSSAGCAMYDNGRGVHQGRGHFPPHRRLRPEPADGMAAARLRSARAPAHGPRFGEPHRTSPH